MMKCYRNIPHSLIPRPFPPVVHRLQYGNTEGEALGDVVTCDDIRLREGRYTEGGRGGLTISKPFLVISIAGLQAKRVRKTASIQFDVCNASRLVNVKLEL